MESPRKRQRKRLTSPTSATSLPPPTEPPPVSPPEPGPESAAASTSRPLPGSRQGLRDFLVVSVNDDNRWIDSAPTVKPGDEELSGRLITAYRQSRYTTFNENLKLTLRHLLQFGIIVECDTKLPTTAATTATTAATNSSSISHYIAHTLLNHTSGADAYHFTLQLATNRSLAIPSRSRYIIFYLSARLRINIVPFSTRAKPHFYGVGDAQATIGFLEKTDSYCGTSEFLVLGAARTAPAHDSVGVVASAPGPTVYAYPAATTRTQFRTRRQYEITAQDCSAAIEYASPIRLSQILQAAAEKLVKRREPPKGLSMEQHRAEVRQALYQEEIARQRLPRHTTEIAVMRIRELHKLDDAFSAEQDVHKAKGKQKKTESTGKNGGPSTSKKVDGAEDGGPSTSKKVDGAEDCGPSTSEMVDGAEEGENTDE
ncbi:hypothetical protein KVV02_002668, partial [Mortierella alpina]